MRQYAVIRQCYCSLMTFFLNNNCLKLLSLYVIQQFNKWKTVMCYNGLTINCQFNLLPAFPLTPKRTFLRLKNLSNTSRIFGLGVRKIPNFGCIRPFVFSWTYMNA